MKNHPVTPNQVVSVFNLGYLIGVAKDFSDQISFLSHKKKRNLELITTVEKKNTIKNMLKEK